MEENRFTNLPQEITINILSRLPLGTIAISKCVCKPWLDLLVTDEFVNHHLSLSKSNPALTVLTSEDYSNRCNVFEFADERCNLITKFGLPEDSEPMPLILATGNGLILFFCMHAALRLCNPITREYSDIPCSEEFVIPSPFAPFSYVSYGYDATYGIGASKVSGLYKVVRIDQSEEEALVCHVYTLGGTRSWRRVETNASFEYGFSSRDAFVNGNIYWKLSTFPDEAPLISCFDVETECFTTFLAPAVRGSKGYGGGGGLSVLRDGLCFYDNSCDDEIVIWLMKEYGVEKCWSKEYVVVIDQNLHVSGITYPDVMPVEISKDGDIMMVWNNLFVYYYSNETKTIREIRSFRAGKGYVSYSQSRLLTPSLVSLKRFGTEKVISLN